MLVTKTTLDAYAIASEIESRIMASLLRNEDVKVSQARPHGGLKFETYESDLSNIIMDDVKGVIEDINNGELI